MFSPMHELLVDHLASIVGSGLDVDRLLDDGVGTAAEGLSSPVLGTLDTRVKIWKSEENG